MTAWIFRILIMICCVIYIGDRGYFYYSEYARIQETKRAIIFNAMQSICLEYKSRWKSYIIDEELDNQLKDCREKGYL